VNINLTLFGQTLAFAIFVWFCMKLVWPPITAAMAARQKKIAEGLDAAGRAQQDLNLAQDKVSNTLRETKEQAAQIIEQANKHANAIIEEAKQQARAEGERLVAGDSDEQVIDYLVSRYGEFVLLKPRFAWHTIVLWAAGPVALIAGLIAIVAALRKRARNRAAANDVSAPKLTAEEERRLQALLDKAD